MKITEKELAEKMAKHAERLRAKNDPGGYHPVVSYYGKAVRFNGEVVGEIDFARSDCVAVYGSIRFTYNNSRYIASVRRFSFARDAKKWFAAEIERLGVGLFIRENENVRLDA